ncbi:MAG: T9SS type A sorting domain-containing protein [Saprospiraceae bacterium]
MSRSFTLLFLLFQQLAFAQGGLTWSAPIDIASADYGNLHPRLSVDGAGNPLVIWGNNSNNKVYFSRWENGGFTLPVALNPATIPVFTASWASPDLAASGDTVYVVYKHTPEDINHIYLVHSYDGGVNFSLPLRVDYTADSVSRFPAVGTDAAGNPLVAFMKFDPGFENARYVVARSTDLGNSFLPDVPASGFSGGKVCDCCPATLTTSGQQVALLYRDNLNNLRNNWAGISQDGGKTFPTGIQVDKTNWIINACPSSGPDGVLVGDSLYAVYMSAASGKTLCYFSKSAVSNQQAAVSLPLTGNFPGLALQNFPRIASSDHAVAGAWKQVVNGSGQVALFFTKSISAGLPSNYEIAASGDIENVDLALHQGALYLVWENSQTGTVQFRKGTYPTSSLADPQPKYSPLTLYPNPLADGPLKIQAAGGINSAVLCTIKNSLGETVLQKTNRFEAGGLQIEAVSKLASGLYFLQIQSEDVTYAAKFVKH